MPINISPRSVTASSYNNILAGPKSLNDTVLLQIETNKDEILDAIDNAIDSINSTNNSRRMVRSVRYCALESILCRLEVLKEDLEKKFKPIIKDYLFYDFFEKREINFTKFIERFKRELEEVFKERYMNSKALEQTLNYFNAILDISEHMSCQKMSYFECYNILSESARQDISVQKVFLKNLYYKVLPDITNSPLAEIVRFTNLYIETYFELLAKFPLDEEFTNPKFLLSVINTINDKNSENKNTLLIMCRDNQDSYLDLSLIIDKIFSGIEAGDECYYKFFCDLSKQLYLFANDDATHSLLLRKIINFIENKPFLSDELVRPFARILRFYLNRLNVDLLSLEKKDFFKYSLQDSKKNLQLIRYQVEIVLRILNGIAADYKILKESNKEALKESRAKRIEDLTEEDFEDEIINFVNFIGKSPSVYYTIFELPRINRLLYVRYLKEGREDILFKLIKKSIFKYFQVDNTDKSDSANRNHDTNQSDVINNGNNKIVKIIEQIPENKQYLLLLHPYLIKFLDFFRKEDNVQLSKIFWNIFELLESKKDSAKNSYIKFTSIEVKLTDLIKNLRLFQSIINSVGINIHGAISFYEEVLKLLSSQLKAQRSQNLSIIVSIDSNKQKIDNLKKSIEDFMPRKIDKVDFGKINNDAIASVMNSDSITDDLLFDCIRNSDILRISKEMGKNFGEMFNLYALLSKMIKPVFLRESKDNKNRIIFFEKNSNRKQKFIDNMKAKDAEVNSVEKALSTLFYDLLNSGLCIKEPKQSKYTTYEGLTDFLNGYTVAIEREIVKYMYILKDTLDAYNEFNTKKAHQETVIEKFINERLSQYKPYLSTIKPSGIEKFENNQIMAIYEACIELIDNKPSNTPHPQHIFFKIGTGNGKTLVQATIALEFLKKHPEKKVFIFTGFPHLAKRDQSNMREFFDKALGGNGKSCVLNWVADLHHLKDDTKIIFADSEQFVRAISLCIINKDLENETKNRFLKLIYSELEHSLILLDEFDVLLDKEERRYIYDCIEFFPTEKGHTPYFNSTSDNFENNSLKEGVYCIDKNKFFQVYTQEINNKSEKLKKELVIKLEFKSKLEFVLQFMSYYEDQALVSDDIYNKFFENYISKHILETINQLQKGVFQEINQFFKLNVEYELKLGGNAEISAGNQDQSGNSSRTIAGTIGSQLASGEGLLLKPVIFKLKSNLKASRVIGFSGSFSKDNIDIYKGIFPEISKDHIYEVPLFFDPKNLLNQNVELQAYYCDEDQIGDIIKSLPGKKVNARQPALSEERWLDEILEDIIAAQSRKQPVIIFADDTQPSGFNKIDNFLKGQGYTVKLFKSDADAEDGNLQTIANPTCIALCSKKVGRGADIRIPADIENGLHVIIARPDYEAEIIQEVGRTGRMNKPGTYSLIYKKGDKIPDYGKAYNSNNQKEIIAEQISRKFYLQKPSFEQIGQFCWFLYVYLSGGMRTKKRSGEAELWEFINKNILRK